MRAAAALFALCFSLLSTFPAFGARLALVIGNRDYTVGALKNPINDAISVGNSLTSLGFQVTLVRNLRRDDVGRTVDGFASRIRAGDDVVVFYAGHGLQVKGVNYLPAVDASIRSESDVALNSINLNHLLERLDEAKAGVRLLLIDACRDNPYSRSFRSSSRGLARIEGAPSGTLMQFATRPGGLASDGAGSNGLYTTHLLKHIRAAGVPVESMLKRVASGVRQDSSGDQQPWVEGALDGEFYFAPQTSPSRPEATLTPLPPVPQAINETPQLAPPEATLNSCPTRASTEAVSQVFSNLTLYRKEHSIEVWSIRDEPRNIRSTIQAGDEILSCIKQPRSRICSGDEIHRCREEFIVDGRSAGNQYIMNILRQGMPTVASIVLRDSP